MTGNKIAGQSDGHASNALDNLVCVSTELEKQTDKTKGSQCINPASSCFQSFYGPFMCNPFISQGKKTACHPEMILVV